MQHIYKGEDLLTLKTLVQLHKAKVEGEKRGKNMPKVTRQVSVEVGIKPVFPSLLDSTLTVQNTLTLQGLSAQRAAGLGFYVRVWLEETVYFTQQWPTNKRTKETLEGPL